MSIGDEDVKGSDFTKEVFKLLKESKLNFRGNVEGHDLFENPVEVVLCDGFVGNVVLKTCEAIADAIFEWLKHELKKSPMRMAGRDDRQGRLQDDQEKDQLRGVRREPAAGGQWHLHHRPWRQAPQRRSRMPSVLRRKAFNNRLIPHIVEEIQKYHDAIAASQPAAAQTETDRIDHRHRRLMCRSGYLTNADLEKMVDTSDEWIVTRTGIRERRIAADNEFTSDMAANAAQARDRAGRDHAG